MKYLLLNDNQLTGAIPSTLGNLAGLQILMLENNLLSAPIPALLGSMTSLDILRLHNNALTGEIPSSIVNLVQLDTIGLTPFEAPLSERVNVGYNGLYSTDPTVVAFLTGKDPDWADTQTVAPGDVAVGSVSETSVGLSWTAIPYTGDGGYYEVSVATTPGGPYTVHGVTADKSATAYPVTGLLPETTYYFVVRTFTPAHGEQQNDLWSDYSGEVSTSTLPPLSAPSDLSANIVSDTQVNLSWTDNVQDESAFHIERSPDGSSGWVEVGTVGPDETAYLDPVDVCYSVFFYRVRAFRTTDGKYSDYSNVASAETLCPLLTAPSNLAVVLPTTRNGITLSWTDDVLLEDVFLVERSPDGSTGWAQVGVVSAGSTGFQDNGLTCARGYHYRVRAFRSSDSTYSDYTAPPVMGTTEACPALNPPGNLQATDVSRTGIMLSWQDGNPAGEVTGFVVETSPDGVTGWAMLVSLPGNWNSYPHTGLACDTTYHYRVKALRSEDGASATSNPLNVQTDPCPTAVTNTVGLYREGFWRFRDSNRTGPTGLAFAFGPAEGGWTALIGDWDGDGVEGIGLYKNGVWLQRNVTGSGVIDNSFRFGAAEGGWQAVVGDWDGDGVDTVGLYKDGLWLLRDNNSDGQRARALRFGQNLPGARAIAGDWNGSGRDTVGLYGNGVWYLHPSLSSVERVPGFVFGPAEGGWQPVVGDWNADGADSIGLHKDGIWRLRDSNSSGPPDLGFTFGAAGWQPLSSYRGGMSALTLLSLGGPVGVPTEPGSSPPMITEPVPMDTPPLPTETPAPMATATATDVPTSTPTSSPTDLPLETTAEVSLPTATPTPAP
jgi:hypothetical protein